MEENYEFIPIEEFDELCRQKRFIDGPYQSSFGDNWHDPYVPYREVRGTLDDGRKVSSRKG